MSATADDIERALDEAFCRVIPGSLEQIQLGKRAYRIKVARSMLEAGHSRKEVCSHLRMTSHQLTDLIGKNLPEFVFRRPGQVPELKSRLALTSSTATQNNSPLERMMRDAEAANCRLLGLSQ